MALVGHSLAAEVGATQADYGPWHKIATHLQPARLRSAAQLGALVAAYENYQPYPAGGQPSTPNHSGYARVLLDWPMNQRRTVGPYLPNEQLVCIWYGINDLAWLGPLNIAALQEAFRTVIARFRTASVFENTDTAALSGVTPVAFTGVWSTTNAANAESGASIVTTTTAYPTSKITIKVPPDDGAGTIHAGFITDAPGGGAIWDFVDVTGGGSTTLVSAYDARNRSGFNHGSTRAATGALLDVVKRVAIGASPTTTLTADLKLSDTVVTVAATTGFDTAGTIQVEAERISYAGVTGTTFTGITRNITATAGTSPVHYSGTSVTGGRTIELRPTTITTQAYFDYWALEATQSPLMAVALQPRPYGYLTYGLWPYPQTITKLASGTLVGAVSLTLPTTTLTGALTVAPGSQTVGDPTILNAGSVLVDSEVIFINGANATTLTFGYRGANGTTAATHSIGATVTPWVRVGDTITIGTGVTAETRTVTTVVGATVSWSGGLANTHSTGDQVVSGIQDYDVTNTLNPALASVVSEFADTNIFTVNLEPGLYPTGAKDPAVYAPDNIHFNDEGAQRIAKRFLDAVTPRMTQYSALAKPTVPDRRGYYDSFYSQVVLLNSWSNYSTLLAAAQFTGPPTLGYTKDFITGRVRIKGAIKNTSTANSALSIFQLPVGFRPLYDEDWVTATNQGPQVIRIQNDGNVLFPAGLVDVSYVTLNVMFEAEA